MDTPQFEREIHKIANRCVSEARAVAKKRRRWTQELTATDVAAGIDTAEIARPADAARTNVDEGTWL
ncbi:hypothetical protein B5V02_02025 [Mesorhizobium kowhaii]|uniref:Uncharacterized protein n=2 Tax=Mesorhizobium kowhaii TaxID=1300272 RepID=A0A2W7CA97_9HYPH|nr:hypothetical protein B5V02_02025 [Mesorhizobium kowhaii]